MIATNTSESWAEYAEKDGILVHVAEAGTAMNNNVIGVIMHKNDLAKDARKWAEKQQEFERIRKREIVTGFHGWW